MSFSGKNPKTITSIYFSKRKNFGQNKKLFILESLETYAKCEAHFLGENSEQQIILFFFLNELYCCWNSEQIILLLEF